MPLPRVGREPPADLVADLKRLLPTAELLNIEGPHWWLLNYAPSPERRMVGERRIAGEWDRLKQGLKVRKGAILVGELMRDGYELWGRYQWIGEPPRDRILDDLRQKLAVSLVAMDQAVERQLAEAEAAEGTGAHHTREFLEAEGRSLYRITIRGRKSIHMGGHHVAG